MIRRITVYQLDLFSNVKSNFSGANKNNHVATITGPPLRFGDSRIAQQLADEYIEQSWVRAMDSPLYAIQLQNTPNI